MIKSMTGFGRCEGKFDGMHITVEIKSVNHRYFDFNCRTSRGFGFLEEKAKSYIQSKISRGKTDAFISVIDEDKILLPKQTKKVYIRVPTVNCPATAKIKELLPLYKGNTPVIFFANDTKKQFAVPNNMKIDEKSEIYVKISEIVGNNNIKIVE